MWTVKVSLGFLARGVSHFQAEVELIPESNDDRIQAGKIHDSFVIMFRV